MLSEKDYDMISKHTFNVIKENTSKTIIIDELSFLARTFNKTLDDVVDDFNENTDYSWFIKNGDVIYYENNR